MARSSASSAHSTAPPSAPVVELRPRRAAQPTRRGPAAGERGAEQRPAATGGPHGLLGPLTAAVVPFAAAPPQPGEAPDPAAVLAGLIDLRGGVALAERLAQVDAPPMAVPPSDPAVVRATLHAGLTDIEARLDDAFTHAFRPRYRLPTASRAWQIIERAGLPDAPRPGPRARKLPRELKVANRHLWAPLGEFLDTHLKRARFALRDLRAELEGPLCGLGEDAARLVRLDAALSEATHGSVEQLYRRVAYATEQAFTARLFDEFRRWPEPVDADHFAPGWSPEGWLGDLLADAMALARAIVHHERARIEALVESACALYAPA